MAPQRFEKIGSAPGNGMGSPAANPQDLVRRRADRVHPVQVVLLGTGERVAVSAADDRVIVYADTRRSAESAQEVIAQLATDSGVEVGFLLDRWHPEEERWEDARVTLPSTEAEQIRRGAGNVVSYCDNCAAILVP